MTNTNSCLQIKQNTDVVEVRESFRFVAVCVKHLTKSLLNQCVSRNNSQQLNVPTDHTHTHTHTPRDHRQSRLLPTWHAVPIDSCCGNQTSHPFPFPPFLPRSPPSREGAHPLNPARGYQERCKFSKRVQANPGRNIVRLLVHITGLVRVVMDTGPTAECHSEDEPETGIYTWCTQQ